MVDVPFDLIGFSSFLSYNNKIYSFLVEYNTADQLYFPLQSTKCSAN